MGISIPVGTKHYKQLKIISDKLGIGVKKTVEYLIAYYLEAEISRNPTEAKLPNYPQSAKSIPKETDMKPISANSKEFRSRYDISSEIPSYLADRIDPNPRELKDRVSTDIPPSRIASDIISKDQTLEPSLSPLKDGKNCSICGTPRRNTARYCHNCGNQLQ